MTESTLERAIDLNKQIKAMKAHKKYLEEAQRKCWGNTLDVLNRSFRIEILEQDGTKTVVEVSADSAKKALDADIKIASESLVKWQREFAELS